MAGKPGDAPDAQPPATGWHENVRRILFFVFALAAALCGVARAFGWAKPEQVDRDVLLFLLAAGVLLLLERVSKFSLTKDGMSWETVKSAVAESVKEQVAPVRNDMNAIKTEVAQVEKTATRAEQTAVAGVGRREPSRPADAPPTNALKRAMQKEKGKGRELPEPAVTNDPQKNRFGGEPTRNGRELRAAVEESDYLPGLYYVTLEVRATAHPPKPLMGTVTFYLHDTFDQPVQTVAVSKEGVARLEVSAYGAFTVGAVADEGETLLELDLAEVAEFPKAFREL